MSQAISPFCIYTIRHNRDLKTKYRNGGTGEFTEKNRWVTGSELFLAAKDKDARVPVIFAAADTGGGLLYRAFLTDVEVNDTEATTTYKFVELKPIDGKHPKSSLRLKSTNRPLSDDYIRPYAICFTPSFVK